MKRLEIEAHKAVRLCQLELESKKGTPKAEVAMSDPPSNFSAPQDSLDISKHIALVPVFRETEVDFYFCAFERIAIALKW